MTTQRLNDPEGIAAALADERFISLTNAGSRWELKFRNEDAGEAMLADKDFDSLMRWWLRILDDLNSRTEAAK